MSGELNFEIMPFEAYDGFRTPGGFEVEKEFGRRAGSRGVSARAPRVIPSRSTRASVSPFTGPKKPPVRTPRFRLPRWPRGAAFELMEPPSRDTPTNLRRLARSICVGCKVR